MPDTVLVGQLRPLRSIGIKFQPVNFFIKILGIVPVDTPFKSLPEKFFRIGQRTIPPIIKLQFLSQKI
jgi:hypothetical protein